MTSTAAAAAAGGGVVGAAGAAGACGAGTIDADEATLPSGALTKDALQCMNNTLTCNTNLKLVDAIIQGNHD